MHGTPRSVLLSLATLVVILGAVGLFVVDAGSTGYEPVDFDDTVTMGITLHEEFALEEDGELPRVQAHYSQYRYVVGYYGVETFVETARQEGHDEQFGYPVSVHVTDFSGTDVSLTEEGYPTTDESPGWVAAEDAVYVVGSDARTPAGETVVPFSSRADAEAFAADHGGDVLTWEAVLETRFDVDDADAVRDRVADQHREADATVAAAHDLRDRPVSLVVGEDVETIGAAIEEAPANTTVVVPEGTYDETVEVDRPITLRGEGEATLRGDGTGTVVTVSTDRAAVVGLEITGVGETLRDEDAEAFDHHHNDYDAESLEEGVEEYYATGDAGVAAMNAPDALIEDVTIETPANGVMLGDSPDAVVRNVTVRGSDSWREGHMGVLAMHSPAVVEESTFVAGRDGVYTHRSDGIVVRDNEMRESRFGVHLMFTSGSLIADNEVREQDRVGVYVMTGPERNAVVGNDVRENPTGIRIGGSDSYLARNLLEGNDVGVWAEASGSIYEHNVFAGNVQGVQVGSNLPTNRVVANDFVGNYRHAVSSFGPFRVWTHDDRGNYWHGAVGSPDGAVLDRPYSPTHAVDERLHYVDGAPTLARAPALDAIRGLEASVPGARAGSVVDAAPLCEPANPQLLEETDWNALVEEDERCETVTTEDP